MLPDKKLGVVVLTNSDTAEELIYGVIRKCLKEAVLEKYDMAPSPPDLPTYISLNDPPEIAGVYVKKSGYDKIVDNGDGSLTWTRNAQAQNPESIVLTYQDDVYRTEGRTESIIFKNMPWDGMDYFVMIQSGSSGSESDEYRYEGYVRKIVGQKVSVPSLSEAWKARLGVYVMDNLPWDDLRWPDPFSQFAEKDKMLIRDMENAAIPENDDTAFLVGLASRSDSSIRVIQEDGREKLLCGGYRVYPIEQVPPVASGDVVSGTVSLFKSDWYRFDAAAPGQTVNIKVSTDPSNYALTLFVRDPTLVQPPSFVAREMGAISWPAAHGPYFVAISPTPDASGNYTMTVE